MGKWSTKRKLNVQVLFSGTNPNCLGQDGLTSGFLLLFDFTYQIIGAEKR